jgi:EAL domain-containing protein (putative c-di-GMP-specific phosphodiesterase class I)
MPEATPGLRGRPGASSQPAATGAAASDDAVVVAGVLAGVLDVVGPRLDGVVDDFYHRLGGDHQVRAVVERLTEEDFDALRRAQADHLRMLLSPDLDARARQERSRDIGRVHAMVGVDLDVYAAAVNDHRRAVGRLLSDLVAEGALPGLDLARVQDAVTERFLADLHGSVLGFRDLDVAQNRVLLRVLRSVASAHTVSDLARGLVDALGALEGIEVALFVRPDRNGAMLYETGAGPGFDRFVAAELQPGHAPRTVGRTAAAAQGPMSLAWRTGDVRCCDSWATDPRMAPWRHTAERLGWQSSASVPLVDRRGRSRALLSLQARRAGFFASPGQAALLEQVKQVAEQALAELEERPTLASGVSGHLDRATHLAGLAQGRVEMVYQPVVALPSGRLHRLEALARLRAPDGRLVSPAEFLPAFGDEELFELFELGLHQALGALGEWEREGLSTDVSVNLPVVATEDERYARLLRDLLEGHGVEPHRLTLELLETGFDDAQLGTRRRFVEDLKRLGVRLAQDDLGSGYSSLLRLRHLPFDEVKIDQSLVRGSDLAPGHALHFVQPLRDIAHSQGLSVVVEGLEDGGLVEAAVQLGVDEGQGYGIARPMRRGDVVAWTAGYRLDVDPTRPRTPMGGLAGHLVWAHRVRALGEHAGRRHALGLETCTLTAYLDRAGDDETLAAHLAAHAVSPNRPEGRLAWERLVALVCR